MFKKLHMDSEQLINELLLKGRSSSENYDSVQQPFFSKDSISNHKIFELLKEFLSCSNFFENSSRLVIEIGFLKKFEPIQLTSN